jgi:hypothetical protein
MVDESLIIYEKKALGLSVQRMLATFQAYRVRLKVKILG